MDSIRTQTYSDIEVIMVDDGSTDGSRNVANGYAERDNRFRLFSQENVGVSAARNHGLDVAEGEYILFVDSDDWLEPQMIEKLVIAQTFPVVSMIVADALLERQLRFGIEI